MSNNIIKIDKSKLQKVTEQSVIKYFGDWTDKTKELRDKFLNGNPYPHIVIDNFLEQSYANKISKMFPELSNSWHEYKNPIEVKYAYDNINLLDEELKNYFYYLSTPEVINKIKSITDIDELEYDEYLHGAGLHLHPRFGRLNLHLDYEKHPITGKERRLNIILFMSDNWKTEWNGANELWNTNVTECISKTEVKFNRAIIFKTNDDSWHGLPEKILCPIDIFRKSLAYYYVSDLTNIKLNDNYRSKANFVKRPNDPFNENIQKLYDIRNKRRITQEDLELLCPNWTVES